MVVSKNKKNEIELNPAVKKIADILSLTSDDVAKLKIEQQQKGAQAVIGDLLKGNEKVILADKKAIILLLVHYKKDITSIIDKKFQNNRQIAILSIKKDYKNFYKLLDELKSDYSLGKIVLESMVRQGLGLEKANLFIDDFFTDPKINKNLKNHYLDKLERADKIYKDDLSKGILLIKRNETFFYKLLSNRNVFSISFINVKLNKAFITEFLNYISSIRDLEGLESDELKIKQRELLSKFLGVSIDKLDSDDLFVFDTIFNLIDVGENIKKLSTKKESKEEYKTKLKIKLEKKEKQNLAINQEEKLDFCVGEYECTALSGGYYSVATSSDKKIEISKQELENFTTVGLKNFIKFYEMLGELGLNFLWDKNKSSFINLLNNKIGFNYPDGEGVTESRALRVLNLLGCAIGLIGDEEECDYNKDFDTIRGARLAFKKIKSSGKIGKENYEVDFRDSDSSVKKALKSRGFMSKEGELNFSKF